MTPQIPYQTGEAGLWAHCCSPWEWLAVLAVAAVLWYIIHRGEETA